MFESLTKRCRGGISPLMWKDRKRKKKKRKTNNFSRDPGWGFLQRTEKASETWFFCPQAWCCLSGRGGHQWGEKERFNVAAQRTQTVNPASQTHHLLTCDISAASSLNLRLSAFCRFDIGSVSKLNPLFNFRRRFIRSESEAEPRQDETESEFTELAKLVMVFTVVLQKASVQTGFIRAQ